MYRIKCAEVWGGSRAIDTDVCTNGLTASLFSTTSDGGGAEQRGGDIYYLSVCQHDLVTRVCLADVVGHGAAISHVSRWLYDALTARIDDLDSRRVLDDLNDLIYERGLEAMTTAAVLTFYQSNSELNFSYAGHAPLLLRRKGKSEWRIVGVKSNNKPSNLPLGILADTVFDQETARLASGDRIVIYTDGVTEAMNDAGELFGLPRLINVLEQTGDAELSKIKQAVRVAALAFAESNLTPDDFTLIAIEID